MALGLLAVCCSGGPAGSPKVDPIHGDACDLLTSAEVESVMQVPVSGSPSEDGDGRINGCLWSLGSEAPSMVSVSLGPAEEFSNERNANDQTVPDIGDGAYWDSMNGLIVSIAGVTMSVVAFDEKVSDQAAETQLGRLAAKRL
jgi:hypothetical protein